MQRRLLFDVASYILMDLMPEEVRVKIPGLYKQEELGPDAVAYVKYFIPSAKWTWYCLEGEPVLDGSSREVDFQFFGLVDGHDKELGYFMLSELEEVRGPRSLPIERDLYWQPKTLAKIAPEMFREDY